ncbi:class I SAM-dependent methyltransferase [Aquibacillus rhizosphaerae]|uniref:Class I SAM-dependent methyltransferase n=1 Tax=Aquibacillus rhizosphaerae TaxID=3051431 RepID=A0ABT7L456_9BACI|nr:class I SAM-dependent methyltransferase [Aquibacillus sp. LR5S19]MDL4839962.1 class I SAM-dependent methyltransferase [Aquibacillus sp. LR5S19]
MLGIMNSAHTEMNKWAFEQMTFRENMKILDIGCGGGRTIQLLSKQSPNGKIYGIDYSQQAVNNSIKANKRDVATGKVHICQANVIDLAFPNNYFDVATAFQTHYFWPDLENGVKEVYRVLKPEGSFSIVAEVYKINYHMDSYNTKEEIEQCLKRIGFNKITIIENKTKKWICIKGIK